MRNSCYKLEKQPVMSVWDTALLLAFNFRNPYFFPSNSELARSVKANGNHSYVILSHFKEWLSKGAEDVAFKHHSNTFCHYGPLMQLYEECIRHCDGRAREVAYKLLVPVYSKLGFRN